MNTPLSHPAPSGRRLALPALAQRGAASLVVVMVLFFVMAMVAAYANRNLIFEARTSVNQYRSTQAFETAEAGAEWAIAMLNGGRIANSCLEAGAATTDTSFRQRYLQINVTDGKIAARTKPSTPAEARVAGCVWNGASWSCSCPSDADPTLSAPTGPGVFPAFWVRFSDAGIARAGVVRAVINGCTRLDSACLKADDNTTEVEGLSRVTVLLALKKAVTTAPVAALTVRGNIAGGGSLSAANESASTGGITIHAGGVVDTTSFTLKGAPGTPAASSVIANDMSLMLDGVAATATNPAFSASDRVFASTFASWPETYKRQPAAVRITCPVAGCRDTLSSAVSRNPGKLIWIEGDLSLESAGDIGSAHPDPTDDTVAGPTVIVATGSLKFLVPGVRIYGLVYTRSGDWMGSGEIQGAAFSESDLGASAAAQISYSKPVIDELRARHGSFVRVPGGWKDFP